MVVKRTGMLLVGVLVVLIGSVSAQAAGAKPKPMEGEMLRTLKWQLALEREGFSPGIIDGCLAGKTLSAVKEYQRCRGLPVTGKLDEATSRQLGIADADPVAEYTVQSSDAAKVTGVPGGWVEKSKKRYLGYRTLLEAVAEK
ncbi:MAG TPA: peptidoglycan-binding domain-containing protein, partial [Tepidisphaeraceae bacterium]|nr:peptidoglycan-binding domain-containing protein [Tepidisphaeraceae bacterium]